MLNMGITVVSASEIQAEGLLSDPCSDFGRKKNTKHPIGKYLNMSPTPSIWSRPKSHLF